MPCFFLLLPRGLVLILAVLFAPAAQGWHAHSQQLGRIEWKLERHDARIDQHLDRLERRARLEDYCHSLAAATRYNRSTNQILFRQHCH